MGLVGQSEWREGGAGGPVLMEGGWGWWASLSVRVGGAGGPVLMEGGWGSLELRVGGAGGPV